MIRATYSALDYSPDKVTARYVRLDVDDVWQWCEVGPDRRYDIRQGLADASDIPADIRAKAESLQGFFPSYVAWPFA